MSSAIRSAVFSVLGNPLCLHVATNFFCIPAFCSKLELYLFIVQFLYFFTIAHFNAPNFTKLTVVQRHCAGTFHIKLHQNWFRKYWNTVCMSLSRSERQLHSFVRTPHPQQNFMKIRQQFSHWQQVTDRQTDGRKYRISLLLSMDGLRMWGST